MLLSGAAGSSLVTRGSSLSFFGGNLSEHDVRVAIVRSGSRRGIKLSDIAVDNEITIFLRRDLFPVGIHNTLLGQICRSISTKCWLTSHSMV